uniref:SWIM-type domain-containing protein n=1 Tax=Heterorhabditis bacteriophora TaxID=37862 RepID=A0A1I7XGZ6_HETBA
MGYLYQEYQIGNPNIVINIEDKKQTVYVFKCEGSVIMGESNSMSLSHRLALATQLRLLMKDLEDRLSSLASKEDALPIIGMLAGIVDEEILLQGVALVDGGCVKLLVEESELQAEEEIEKQYQRLKRKVSKQRSTSVSQKILGAVSVPSTALLLPAIDHNHIRMRFYEVSSNTASQHSFFLIPNVNFCICEYYQKRVLEAMEQFTCPHFLATWLSSSLHNVQRVPTRPETLEIIARHLSSRTQEFY